MQAFDNRECLLHQHCQQINEARLETKVCPFGGEDEDADGVADHPGQADRGGEDSLQPELSHGGLVGAEDTRAAVVHL